MKILDKWCNLASEKGVVAIDCETTSMNPLKQNWLVFQCRLKTVKLAIFQLNITKEKMTK